MLTRFISNFVADHVPLHYRNWRRVPFHYYEAMYLEIQTYFNLDMYRGSSEKNVKKAGPNFKLRVLMEVEHMQTDDVRRQKKEKTGNISMVGDKCDLKKVGVGVHRKQK
ncbi:unnamed protein product [Lactuca virosa]|uniref:PiggyBac transposable element-derived protein domain-containing protein n=1 Tax=Lactuca virosa TaxID=75947 RepID=A0AAU9MFA8_9ASTR|nr:unnamed protein product [Lactuca virosa]